MHRAGADPDPTTSTMPSLPPRTSRTAVALLHLVLLGAPLAAQDEPEPEPPPDWGFELDVGLTSSGGNEDLTVLTTSTELTRITAELFELELTGRFRYGRSDDETVARNIRSSLKVDLYPDHRVSPFLFTSVEHDPFRRLDFRNNSGGGVKYTFVHRDDAELSLSVASLYSYENFDQSVESPLDEIQHNARWSGRLRGSRDLSDAVAIQHTTFYQPIWDQADDYLLDSETALRVRVVSGLALRVSFIYQRDSSPPPDVEKDDRVVTLGVTFATEW